MIMTTPPPKIWLVRVEQTLTFAFLLYVLFLLGRSALVNAKRNQETANLRHQITALEADIVDLREEIAYQETTSFKELEARRKLGLKKPGELVIALPPEPDAPMVTTTDTGTAATPTYQVLEAWWEYYFQPNPES